MSGPRVGTCALLILAALSWVALGEEGISESARRVLDAFRDDDRERLKALVDALGPDTGAVTSELEKAGHLRAAAEVQLHVGGRASNRGEYVLGLDHVEAAVRNFTQAKDEVGRARALHTLAVIRLNLSELPRALETAREAARAHAALGRPAGEAMSLVLVARVVLAMGEEVEALEAMNVALEKALATHHPAVAAEALDAQAHLHLRFGRWAEAEKVAREAAAAWIEAGLAEAAAASWNKAGLALAEQERYEEAIACHRKALTIFETEGTTSSVAHTYWYLGESFCELEAYDQALDHFHRAHDLLTMSTLGLTPEQGAGAREHLYWLYEMAVEAAIEAGRMEDACFFLEALRGRALLEAMTKGAAPVARLPEALARELEDARAREAKALAALRQARVVGKLRAIRESKEAYETARARLQEVVERARRRTGTPGEASRDLVRVSEAQAVLAPDEAVVLYGLGSEEAIAFVITRERLRLVRLGRTARIVAAVEDLAKRARPDSGGWWVARWRLRRRLIAPLKLPAACRRLYVSPHRVLNHLPFAFLIEDREVTHVPSLTTFVLLRRRPRAESKGVLAVGNPDLRTTGRAAPGDTTRAGLLRLGPLPEAEKEAAAIGTRVLTGEEATESRVLEALAEGGRWKAVHLACHGVVTPETPHLSSLALAGDARHDGFVTLLDVYGMRVEADLVVLSACDSGLGQSWMVEGLVGFHRAFLAAGARAVLVSLIEVNDQATRVLMTEFYRQWNPASGKGVSAAAALRAAQGKVKSRPGWEHPSYWAPWVLWGLAD